MAEWQPIETAPRDGTFILTVEFSGHVHIVQWCAEGRWRTNLYDDATWAPTHWMPLPEAPAP